MATNTGELRELLTNCIEDVRTGKLGVDKANAIAKLAGQVSLSMQVELNVRLAEKNRSLKIGSLPIGDERDVIDQPAQATPQLSQ